MSDLPPEKKLRMTELKMTETESPVLSADELNRFSRQNAALGIKSYWISLSRLFPHLKFGTCDHCNLYNRTILIIGAETTAKLIKMKILIVGLRGIGIETAKNLALQGAGAITVWFSQILYHLV